jgi:Tfp pilus assembly protein PilF
MMRISAACVLVAAVLLGAAPAGASGGGMSSSSSDFPDVPQGPSPDDIKASYNAGVAAVTAQDWKTAVRKVAFVTENSPNMADAWNYLAYSSRKDGNPKKSEAAYKRALKIDPNHPRANEYYGELLLELNRIPEAEQRLAVLQSCCAANAVTAELAGLIADAKAGKSTSRLKPSLGY